MNKVILTIIFLGLINLSFISKVIAADNGYEISEDIPKTAWLMDSMVRVAPASYADAIKKEGRKVYYIDMNHASATNSDNEFGTPDKPRLTIPEIPTMQDPMLRYMGAHMMVVGK